MAIRNFSRAIQQRQKGAVAIEFVFIFPVFFIICYAIVVYGLAFLLVQNYTYASEEVLRAAMACEHCNDGTDDNVKIAAWETEIQSIGNARLKKDETTGLLIYAPGELPVVTCQKAPTLDGILCQVSISAAPVLDGITMPGFGKLPSLPNKLTGKASLLF